MKKLALILMLASASPAMADAPVWNINYDASRLGFTTYWQNSPVNGFFKKWMANVRFDPDDLNASSVNVEIQTDSVDTNYKDRDVEIRKSDWLSVESFPIATFSARRFRRLKDNNFVADGTLELKGTKSAVLLPFTLEISGQDAQMKGKISISRLAFNVGEGQWRSTDFIKEEIVIHVQVAARRGN